MREGTTRMRRGLLLFGSCLLLAACAEPGDVGSTGAALTSVPELSNGRSTIEDRYVYAPPDEGSIEFDMTQGFCLPNEFCFRGLEGEVHIRIDYSKSANTVDLYANWTEGAYPYRQTFSKDFDDSTAFNTQPTTVSDGRWQMWMMGSIIGRYQENAYYDATTLDFIGTRYDFEPIGPRPWPPAGTYFPVPATATRMFCTPLFESNPDGSGSAHFTFNYDRMEDMMGTPGVIALIIPYNLCRPDELNNYWTQTRLPDEMYMSWDWFLESIWNGEGIGVASSYEPFPKPAYLAYRDATFIGWGNMYPQEIPRPMRLDMRSFGTLIEEDGINGQLDPWPAGSVDLCGGGL